MSKARNLANLIFDEVEVLDFCGPFEVFSVANRFTDPPAFACRREDAKVDLPEPIIVKAGEAFNECRPDHEQ